MTGKAGLAFALAGWMIAGALIPLLGAAPLAVHAQEVELFQWRNSPHARSMSTPDERERMNQPGCAHCHTVQGYLEVTLGGGESTAPYPDATGLICRACHLPAEGGVGVGALRAGSAREACNGCHDELVSNTADYLSWTSQVGLFSGEGGAHIPGVEYPTSAHTALEDGCVSCHMAPAGRGLDPVRVGGHTFWVKTKGEGPELFNLPSCSSCHEGITAQGVSLNQRNFQSLMEELAELLPQKPHPDEPDATEPRYPADPSLDEIQRRASHNYWLIQKDGSLGVHNPRYGRALLLRSIGELQAGLSGGR